MLFIWTKNRKYEQKQNNTDVAKSVKKVENDEKMVDKNQGSPALP